MRRLVAFLLLLALAVGMISCSEERDPDSVQIYFFDVGQGDAALLRTPDGDVLIDTGTEDSQELLCLRLEQLGVTEIKLMILSHNDEDHIGGADGIVSRFSVEEIWVNGAPFDNESAMRLKSAADARAVPIRAVSAMHAQSIGGVRFTVLSPLRPSEVQAGNEDSLFLTVWFGSVGMIFAGDVEQSSERELLSYYSEGVFDCTLYKASHHGASDASSEELLRAMTPRYAVISCAAGNAYGHPSGEVLFRLEAVGATVLRTDLLGEIVFECDGKALHLLNDKK